MRSVRSFAFVGVAGLALAVSGCSSSSAGSEGTATPAPAATTAAAATTADSAAGSGTDARLASRLCTALSKTTAQMQMSDASPEAAMAQTAIALADVYGDDVAQMDATKIEEMTKTTCPEVHDEAIKTMKVDSLDALR